MRCFALPNAFLQSFLCRDSRVLDLLRLCFGPFKLYKSLGRRENQHLTSGIDLRRVFLGVVMVSILAMMRDGRD